MKTKQQKENQIKNTAQAFQKNETVLVTDFTGLSVNELTGLRKSLRALGMAYQVVKKRLLKIAFEKEGISFNRDEFPGQAGVVFSPKNLHETASVIYTFAKEKNKKEEVFKILGGFSLREKAFIAGSEVKKIGALPSREILLGQLVGMLASPIRSFLFVLHQKSQQTVETVK